MAVLTSTSVSGVGSPERKLDLDSELSDVLDDATDTVIAGRSVDCAEKCAAFVEAYDNSLQGRSIRPPMQPADRDEWFSELVQALPFILVPRYPFARADHINILEADVRLSLLKHLARDPANFATRQLFGQV